jgi:hypothetical protein
VAAIAANSGSPRGAAEDRRRTERQISEIDQIGFAATPGHGIEDLARPVEGVLVQLGSGRQYGLIAINGKRSWI